MTLTQLSLARARRAFRMELRASRTASFLSLEGLNGVGKTEVAKLLASLSGGEFYRLTSKFGDAKLLMTRPNDVDSRMCLFVAALLHSSVRIQERLRAGN